ncbi:MAG: energy transducer TonB [Acidobacteria bacterium]|nr:energy transducer TonB [Acidobacteriota bacterium]
MRIALALFLLANITAAAAQPEQPALPCPFSNELLRHADGTVVWMKSKEMRLRAVRKVDIKGPVKQADIKATVIIDVLVDASGDVACLHTRTAHPLVKLAVESALKQWRFKPQTVNGRPVAFAGRLRFDLCNILCGGDGPSMTLLN